MVTCVCDSSENGERKTEKHRGTDRARHTYLNLGLRRWNATSGRVSAS
jgi:hypothetical protein